MAGGAAEGGVVLTLLQTESPISAMYTHRHTSTRARTCTHTRARAPQAYNQLVQGRTAAAASLHTLQADLTHALGGEGEAASALLEDHLKNRMAAYRACMVGEVTDWQVGRGGGGGIAVDYDGLIGGG